MSEWRAGSRRCRLDAETKHGQRRNVGVLQTVRGEEVSGAITWDNPCSVVDRTEGRVWLVEAGRIIG